MKKLFSLMIATLSFALISKAQNVAVNNDGSAAAASAMLDVKSTTKGMLVPRMTTIQRTSISSPANGLLVYDTDTNSFWYYKGSGWANLAPGGSGGQLVLPFDTTVFSLTSPFTVRNTYGSTSVAIKAENLAGYGIYGYTSSGKGVYGYANGTGNGVEGYSASGIGVRAISGTGNAILAVANGTEPTIEASSNQGDGIYATTSATVKAAVKGETSASASMGVYGLSSAANGYGVRGFSAPGTGVYGQTNIGYGIVASANTGVGLRTSSTSGNALEVFGKLKIYGSAVAPQNGAVLTSDAEGNATWKINKVAFKASGAGAIAASSSYTVVNNVEEYDYSNHYNTSTGMFTAPVTGVYSFGATAHIDMEDDVNDNIEFAQIGIYVYRGGVQIPGSTLQSHYGTMWNGPNDSRVQLLVYGDIRLQAGDVVKVSMYHNNSADATLPWSGKFYGHLVFAE